MDPIIYINRQTGQEEVEQVYGEKALKFLYGKDYLSKILGAPFLHFCSKYPFFSSFYGWWQKQKWTKSKIQPFIEKFGVDPSEFADPLESFTSFNDFFIRHLKPASRPFPEDLQRAVIPADGRYWFYQNIENAPGIIVKGQKFSLADLLQNADLAKIYAHGSMLIARLCPTDYHRFHFPCPGTPEKSQLINGHWYSVNPVALRNNIGIFTQNKRCLTPFVTTTFGTLLYLEIGATNVGSIHQTFQPYTFQPRGAEKGYFSFGGSALILLFLPGAIQFDQDLLEATQRGREMKCLMGESLGRRGF